MKTVIATVAALTISGAAFAQTVGPKDGGYSPVADGNQSAPGSSPSIYVMPSTANTGIGDNSQGGQIDLENDGVQIVNHSHGN